MNAKHSGSHAYSASSNYTVFSSSVSLSLQTGAKLENTGLPGRHVCVRACVCMRVCVCVSVCVYCGGGVTQQAVWCTGHQGSLLAELREPDVVLWANPRPAAHKAGAQPAVPSLQPRGVFLKHSLGPVCSSCRWGSPRRPGSQGGGHRLPGPHTRARADGPLPRSTSQGALADPGPPSPASGS